MARQVKRQNGALHGEAHSVPRMGILGSTVQQHDLWTRRTPLQARQYAAVAQFMMDTGNLRYLRERQGELRCVFVKH